MNWRCAFLDLRCCSQGWGKRCRSFFSFDDLKENNDKHDDRANDNFHLITFFSCSGVVFSTLGSFTSFFSLGLSTGCGVDSLLSLDDFDRDDDGVSGCLSVSCDCTDTVSSSKSSGIAALRGSCKREWPIKINIESSRFHKGNKTTQS